MDFNLSLDDISKQFKDITKLFTSSGPGLPVADLDMVIEADRMYAEGSSRWHPLGNASGCATRRASRDPTAPHPVRRALTPSLPAGSRSRSRVLARVQRGGARRARRRSVPPGVGARALPA